MIGEVPPVIAPLHERFKDVSGVEFVGWDLIEPEVVEIAIEIGSLGRIGLLVMV